MDDDEETSVWDPIILKDTVHEMLSIREPIGVWGKEGIITEQIVLCNHKGMPIVRYETR